MLGKKVGFALAAAFALTACGNNAFSSLADKNSDAAKQEQAQMDINSGNYATAITTLAALCPNNGSGVPTCPTAELTQELASAYMGSAGLDVLTLVKTLDAANKGTNTNVDFANISTSIGLSSAVSTSPTDIAAANTANAAHLASINSAIQVLSSLPSPTADQQLQLGIAQASAAVIAIGSTTGGYDSNGIPMTCGGNCATSSTIGAALSANVPGTTTPAALYAANQLFSASSNINSSVAGNTGTNSTVQQTNDLNFSIANLTPGNASTCHGAASSSYTPVTLTATQVTSYVTTCLH